MDELFHNVEITLPPSIYVPYYRERLAVEYESTGELLADLGSDQTSCHNPFNGGYYPVQLTFDQANDMMVSDPVRFKNLVQER